MMLVHHYFEHVDYLEKGFHVAAFPEQHPSVDMEIKRWCWQMFGQEGYMVNSNEIRWKDSIEYGEIRFQREEDLSLFLLKWAS